MLPESHDRAAALSFTQMAEVSARNRVCRTPELPIDPDTGLPVESDAANTVRPIHLMALWELNGVEILGASGPTQCYLQSECLRDVGAARQMTDHDAVYEELPH